MGVSYGQFCPVAKAMELVNERWTLLIVRELIMGSRHFNELRRGVPKMSPTLLSQRLRRLTSAGIVERQAAGGRVTYILTPAGEELRPVVEALGAWGIRWIPEIGDEELDPRLLLWDMHRHVDRSCVPAGRTVLHVVFPELAVSRHWWLVIDDDDVDVCDIDPGHPVAVELSTSLRCLIAVWRGDLTWSAAIKSGSLRLIGPEPLRRAAPGWFRPSSFVGVPRPQRERAATVV